MKSWKFGALSLSIIACGCGDAMTAFHMGKNVSKKNSHLKIYLDDQLAVENKMKKAMSGYSGWKIKEQVGTSPTLKFHIENPEKFGRITFVSVSLYQQFEADYSNQAEYTIVSKSQEQADQMKPDTAYDFGHMPEGFNITDVTGKTVDKIDLRPGFKYKILLTVKADRSETGIIEFKTK